MGGFSLHGQTPETTTVHQLLDDQRLSSLFFIGTSAEMGRREVKAGELLEKLLTSGLDGQLKEGDHFAIVGYGKNGYQVVLPPAVWTRPESAMQGKSAREALRLLRYEGAIGWANVAPLFSMLMRQHQQLHAVILSDGIEPFYGTQWDAEIQTAMASQRVAAANQKVPVVLRITGSASLFASWSVSEAGSQVVFAPQAKKEVPLLIPTAKVVTPVQVALPSSKPAPPAQEEKPLVLAKAVQIEIVKPAQPTPVIEVARQVQPPPTPAPAVVAVEPRQVEVAPRVVAAPPLLPVEKPVVASAREFALDPAPPVTVDAKAPETPVLTEPTPSPGVPAAEPRMVESVVKQREHRTPVDAAFGVNQPSGLSFWAWLPALALPAVGIWFYQRSRRSTVQASLISRSYRDR